MNYSETSREMDEWEKFEEIEVRSLGAGVTNIGDGTTNRGGRTWNVDVNKECKVKHRYNFWFYNPPPPTAIFPVKSTLRSVTSRVSTGQAGGK